MGCYARPHGTPSTGARAKSAAISRPSAISDEAPMNPLAAHLPIDRLQALMRGRDLPRHSTGTIVFADIAGFTPLTERLMRSLGARRGAEELTVLLDRVYDPLITLVHAYGGSV